MNAYTEQLEYWRNLTLEKKVRIQGDKKGTMLRSYLEEYGALIPSCLDDLDLEHLEALEEAIFTDDLGSEGVVFVFRYTVPITDKMVGWQMLPANNFCVRLFRPVAWVDRY